MRHLYKPLVLLVVLLTALVTGIAVASWLSSGTGSGNAKATTAQALSTVDASASTTSQLYPGGTGDLKITIHNPNPYPIRVASITQNGAVTGSGGTGTCTTTGVSLSALSSLTDDVPANSSVTFTHAAAISMTNASDDGCQGATFTIPVSLTGASNA